MTIFKKVALSMKEEAVNLHTKKNPQYNRLTKEEMLATIPEKDEQEMLNRTPEERQNVN